MKPIDHKIAQSKMKNLKHETNKRKHKTVKTT